MALPIADCGEDDESFIVATILEIERIAKISRQRKIRDLARNPQSEIANRYQQHDLSRSVKLFRIGNFIV